MSDERLEVLLPSYYESKDNMEKLKKKVDLYNTEIKEIMESSNEEEVVVNGYKAKVSTSTKITMDNDRLLMILKQNLTETNSDLFYVKEFVNMDELERMLYNNLLPQNVVKLISECKTEKEIKSLRVSKEK